MRTLPAADSFRFPDEDVCAKVNSAAVFHPMAGPGDEGLPCIEIAGVLVFAYLDADIQAVRVSVHLDTTDELLVQPGTGGAFARGGRGLHGVQRGRHTGAGGSRRMATVAATAGPLVAAAEGD
ncbi:hypothetical protein AB0N26_32430 [Streptomyces cellulosae]